MQMGWKLHNKASQIKRAYGLYGLLTLSASASVFQAKEKRNRKRRRQRKMRPWYFKHEGAIGTKVGASASLSPFSSYVLRHLEP